MTVRTRAQLNSDADTLLPDNAAGEISPQDVRERIKDLADSAVLPEDVGSISILMSGISLLAFEVADLKGVRMGMVGGIADAFDSETDVDTTTSTNESYSAASDLYSPALVDSSTESSSGVGTSQAAGAAYTIFDMAWKINNSTIINKVGVYDSAGANTYTVKIGKRNSAGNFDIVVSESLSHTGSGWEDKTLTTPYEVPSTGDYYAGMANPDGAVGNLNVLTATDRAAKSGDITGLGQSGFTETLSSNVEPVRVTYAVPGNMTLVSNAFTATAVPTTARLALFVDPQVAMTINTDLTGEVSRDGGTTWTAATLASVSNPVGTVEQYEDNSIDISAQPSGSSMKYRVKTLNNKDIDVTGVVFQWS